GGAARAPPPPAGPPPPPRRQGEKGPPRPGRRWPPRRLRIGAPRTLSGPGGPERARGRRPARRARPACRASGPPVRARSLDRRSGALRFFARVGSRLGRRLGRRNLGASLDVDGSPADCALLRVDHILPAKAVVADQTGIASRPADDAARESAPRPH